MNEPRQTVTSSHADLESAAFELIEALRENPSAENQAVVAAFRGRSVAHSDAVDSAEQFFDLLKRAPSHEAGAERWLNLDLFWARLMERWIGLSSFAVVALALGFFALYGQPESERAALVAEAGPDLTQTARYTTAWGQQREVVLPDGTTLWLGWKTELDASIGPKLRHVDFQKGALALKVAPDAARPFVVTSGAVTTTVTGTEFLITHQQETVVDVAVIEGSVQVEANARTVALKAQEGVEVKAGVLEPVSSRSLDEIGQWRNGLLVFDERPIVDAILAVQPYTRLSLDLADIQDHPGLVTGAFFIDEAESSLSLILQAHQLEAVQRGNSLKIRRSLRRPK